MVGASNIKKRKGVVIQEGQSSEEEQDKGGPKQQRGANHLRMAENMLNASRKRREAKRKGIMLEYEQKIKKLEAKIETFYGEREAKMTQIQDTQWRQLSDLLKTRRSIEKAIFKNITIIEQATLNMSRELDTVYAARLDEIVEMDTTGRITEKSFIKD